MTDPRVTAQLRADDRERRRFLERLDNAVAINVTDWEAQFLHSHLTSPRPFTDPQRNAIDELRTKYEGQL
jgi:hypothetical protein